MSRLAADSFLGRMAASSQRRVQEARSRIPAVQLEARLEALPVAAVPHFSRKGFGLIAEVKRRSPSEGRLAGEGLSPLEQARSYVQAGALAISVLTEPDEFSGTLDDLAEVAGALPGQAVMRKDFLVDEYQILEARAGGAAGVLLIAAILEPERLRTMLSLALQLGMFVLVEVFDLDDLQSCSAIVTEAAAARQDDGRVLLGVNSRDLRSLQVDFQRFARLAPALPPGLPWVAESGISTPAQAGVVAGLGYSLALVGTALMRAADPRTAAQALLAAGRAASSEE